MTRFRQATAGDADVILELMRGYYSEDGYSFADDDARSALLELVRDSRLGRLWVAEEGGHVVGYLAVTLGFSLEYRGRDAFIDELFLSPEARGKGLGKEAITTALDYCRERGVKAVHLEVEGHRQSALGLYRRSGFVDHHRSLMSRWLGND